MDLEELSRALKLGNGITRRGIEHTDQIQEAYTLMTRARTHCPKKESESPHKKTEPVMAGEDATV